MPEQATVLANPQQNPIKPAQRQYNFTPANAKLMAAKSAEARRAQSQKLIQTYSQPQSELDKAIANPAPDPFVSRSLTRCRQQLDKLYKDLNNSELTPAEIDKLASAIARFSEIERNLAMRPGPGTLKPADMSSSKQSRAGWLLDTSSEPSKTQLNSSSDPVESGRAEQE